MGNIKNREVRVALVLYGGVSLAVYENGVTKAFYDLVKGNGVFGLVLGLLEATAVVDVISGASAGGINGLMLATALSVGSDFDQTSKFWRKYGDIGNLMRPVSKADEAKSLLDGEGCYHDYLREAIKKLLESGMAEDENDGEIDVFIAATDLPGHVETFWDQIGDKIQDKNHRVIFQLKHRKGRKILGLVDEENFQKESPQHRIEKQAEILASIARITSTFPAAFPPFQLDQIDETLRGDVKKALETFGGLSKNVSHLYVDGGVLNNKPFKPVLRAIFYRMPYGLVDRRLFYVEPDPEHISQLDEDNKRKILTPMGTVVSCLTTIPSHQSIGDDLEQLRAHNARIKWLKEIKNKLFENRDGAHQSPASNNELYGTAYWSTRVDSIARSLLLDIDAIPCAGDTMASVGHENLYKGLKDYLLKQSESSEAMVIISSYDIDYHIRRAFHILYIIYDALEAAGMVDIEKTQTTMQAVSRIIKFLKLIREMLFMLRDKIMPHLVNSGVVGSETILSIFRQFLFLNAPHWQPVVSRTYNGFNLEALANRDAVGTLSSSVLSDVARAARFAVESFSLTALEKTAETHVNNESRACTILEATGNALEFVVGEWHQSHERFKKFDNCYKDFNTLDQIFFPLEFASGIHELDEIELVRISPKDAQIGLSKLSAEKKVTGDELAHFAAFFRKDWRSNDILWGKIDGICRIIQSLLDDKALIRIKKQEGDMNLFWDQDAVQQRLQDYPHHVRNELKEAWHGFIAAAQIESNGSIPDKTRDAFEKLKKMLILAGQHEAVKRELGVVYEDMYFQDLCWDKKEKVKTLHDNPSDVVLNIEAKRWAKHALCMIGKEQLGEEFKDMAIGSQAVAGKEGRVPLKILAEYISQAYLLLWGMIENSLDEKKKFIPGGGEIRFFLRSPVLFFYYSLIMMRREKRFSPTLLWSLCAALFAAGITGLYMGNRLFIVPLLLLFLIFAIYNRFR